MALSGTIADWSFADILQVISAQHKSGTLKLQCGDEQVIISFRDGRIVVADFQEAARYSGFLRFLVDTGRLAPIAARQALALLQQRGTHAMALLEETALLDGESLPDAINAFVQELIYRVLLWDEGEYEFTAHEVALPANRAPIATEGLLFEGMRRLDEWSHISTIVQPDTLFQLVRGARVDPDLPRRERGLLRLIDGIQDVRALVRLAPLTEYEVGETLQNLHQAGLVEICLDDQAPLPILELAIDDLEPVPHFQRLLRGASLLLLIAASVLFGLITHGVDWARPTGDLTSPRELQAVRLALEIYRQDRGGYPLDLAELERRGIPLHGAARHVIYRPTAGGRNYALVSSPPTSAPQLLTRAIDDWRQRLKTP